jgi:uncharacterized membrane protein
LLIKNNKKITRDLALDEMRGLAVLMMIAFHFIYDLNHFKWIEVALFEDTAYILWRYFIIGLFLNVVGITLVLKHKNSTFKYFTKRLSKLAIAVTLISLVTYLTIPEKWIYFGILHLILISSLIGFFFINRPKVALIIAIVMLILILSIVTVPDLEFLKISFEPYLSKTTIDFQPLFPWLSMVLIGIYLAYHPWYKKIFITKFKLIQFLGRNALVIYLSHQLVLFNLIYLIS